MVLAVVSVPVVALVSLVTSVALLSAGVALMAAAQCRWAIRPRPHLEWVDHAPLASSIIPCTWAWVRSGMGLGLGLEWGQGRLVTFIIPVLRIATVSGGLVLWAERRIWA